MSGGRFLYQQGNIRDIYRDIEEELSNQGKLKDDVNNIYRREYYRQYPEDRYERVYPKEIQEAMKDAVAALKKAYVYAQRVDLFLSGDDGDESFLRRLNEELNELT